MPDNEITIRKATPGEVSDYVLKSWLNSYAQGFVGKLMRADSRYAIGREAYWREQSGKINRILSTNTVSVRVATYDNEAVGWICDDQSRRRLHFLFVNKNFRRQGVAKLLLPNWFDDANSGAVFIGCLPPPWYSRPDANADGKAPPWKSHVVIDLVSPE
jgi:hypothetical protein